MAGSRSTDAGSGLDREGVEPVILEVAKALSSASQGGFVGLTLETDADWARLKAGLRALVKGVYG